MIDRHHIEAYARKIGRSFEADRVILFGSYATESAGPDSDVDLLVVLDYEGKPWEMAARIHQRHRSDFPLDMLVRSQEQLDERLALGDPFFRDIVRNGAPVYEADRR